MKISIFYDHVKTVQKNEKIAIPTLVASLKRLGVCGFDLAWSEIRENPIHVANELEKWGLSAASVYAIFDFSAGFERGDIDALIKDVQTVGAKNILLVPGFIYDTSKKCQTLENMLRALSYACDVARDNGIHICIEDFDDLRSPTVNIEGLTYFFENEPRLKFNLDTGNFCCAGENIFSAIERFGEKIAHVHLKDRSLTVQETAYVTPCADGKIYYPALCGEGLMQIEAVIEKLKELKYNGYLALEYFGEPQSDKIFKSLDFIINTLK